MHNGEVPRQDSDLVRHLGGADAGSSEGGSPSCGGGDAGTGPATAFDRLVGADIVALIFETAPRKVAKALDHFVKARRLEGLDEEMGVIRLIAAEEELVVAIFEWLKIKTAAMPEHGDFVRRHKNHRVKLAFQPVLAEFRFVLAGMLTEGVTFEGLEDRIRWRVEAFRCADQVKLRILDAEGIELIAFNPLLVAVTADTADVVGSLYRDLEANVATNCSMTLKAFVTARSDYRNKLLYAEDAGFVEMADGLATLTSDVFEPSIRDLLWCLAILLGNDPVVRDWGIVSQFIAL